MKSKGVSMVVLLLCPGWLLSQSPAPAKPSSPQAALQQYKQALDSGDVVAFSQLAAGSPGATLRKLAGPMKKAQEASEKLDRALGEKPAWSASNPFQNDFNPLRGHQLEIVEVNPGEQATARIRFGRANHLEEETVALVQEEGQWRVSLPGEYLKSAKRLTPELLQQRLETLNRLTDLLNRLGDEVKTGKLATREAFLIELAQGVKALLTAETPAKQTPKKPGE